MRTPTPRDFDEPEIEVTPRADLTPRTDVSPPSPVRSRTAAGTPPIRPARQRRNPADEVIESGEIPEKRSLVVRSTTTATDWSDDATEISAIPAQPRRRHVVWLAAAIACGIAAAVLLLRGKPGVASSAALESRAEMIGTTLDGEARAAMVRVEAIAASPVLRAAIETDPSTLADMARDHDVVFPLQRGDVIEVFQVTGETRTLMLRLPAGARPLVPPAAGQTRIEAHDHGVVVVANAPVTKGVAGVAGELVLSTPIDLAPVASRISEHASGAVLEGLGEPIVLLAGGATPNVTLPITTTSPVAGALALAASVPLPTQDRTYAWACMGAALLLLSIFAVSAVRARRTQDA